MTYNVNQLDFIYEGFQGVKYAKIASNTKIGKGTKVYHKSNTQYPYSVLVPKMGGSFSCLDLKEVNNILNKYLL